MNINYGGGKGNNTGMCSSVNCTSESIIVDVCPNGSGPTSAYDFEITYPDGTKNTINSTIPFSFNFTDNGPYVISVDSGKGVYLVIDTVTVNCANVVNPCNSIADISSCVLTLNKRYEDLKCKNDKKANIEKIKLDRAMQLLKLAEYDCECGNGLVLNYINEINDIANCSHCDKDFSIVNSNALGCTDPSADNYDSSATVDNGSCLYAQSCAPVTMPNGSTQSETLIPDPLFEAFLEGMGMGNGILDGKVCTDNINQSTRFDCIDFNINDATGIGDMIVKPMRILKFSDNNLSSINLSQNVDLINLTINRNNLSSLDISNNTLLTNVHLFSNNLTTLDTSNNTALLVLNVVSNNSFSSLNLTNNINLTHLSISACNFTTLDVSMCTNLVRLFAHGNTNLATLNLGSNIDLSVLMGGTNPGRNGNSNFRIENAKSNLNIKVGTSARITQATTLLNNLLTDGTAPFGAFTGYTITV